MTDGTGTSFGCRSARSGSLTMGIAIAVAVETVALHLWLDARHPALAWGLTGLSVLTIAWLVADYRSMGRSSTTVKEGRLEIRVGRRAQASIPLAAIAGIIRPTWTDLPDANANAARDYRNLTKPAEPNVLLMLREPTRVLIAGVVQVPVRRIGLHLDEPDALIAAFSQETST